MTAIATTVANQIRSTAAEHGITLPAEFVAALDTADRLQEAASTTFDVSTEQVTAAILDHIVAGTDWAADKPLQKLLQARSLASLGVGGAGYQRAQAIRLATLQEHADAIVTLFAENTTGAAEVLSEAASGPLNTLGTLTHATGGSVIDPAGWAQAIAAERRFGIAIGVVNSVELACTGSAERSRYAPLRWSDATPDQLTQAYQFGAAEGRPHPGPWDVARTGAPLGVVSEAEFVSRTAQHLADAENAAETAQPSIETLMGTFG